MSIQVQNISNTKLFSLTKISYLYLFIIHSTNTINMNTEKIIREISLTKNLSKNRQKSYNHIIKHYENSNNKTLPELLEEAEIEEEQGIPLRKRNLKQRLLQYKQYLQEKNLQQSTIHEYIQTIKSIYNYYELQIPRLPLQKIKHRENITDIPTLKHIQQAVNSTNNLCYKSIITLQASSGFARTEVYNLTIKDFIDATKEYHTSYTIQDILKELLQQNDVIPTFHIQRQKTGVVYYTFCSPECVHYICQYLLQQRQFKEELTPDLPLFHLTTHGIQQFYKRLNDANNFGWIKTRRFFHSHAMRKFFATTLLKNHVDSLSVHFLLGHSIDSITDAYMKADPRALKLIYMRVVEQLCFSEKLRYYDIDSDEKKELERLRQSQRKHNLELKQLQADVDKLLFENRNK